MSKLLLAVSTLLVVWLRGDCAASQCSSDLDCSLNGDCVNDMCACFRGWKGDECEFLDLRPSPPGGAYGFSPNISSWGAHVIKLPSDDLFHMFVSEFWGGCGVTESWQMDSHIVHATATSALGPYTYVDTALPPEATCMHILVNGSRIVMYHQGRSGSGKGPLKKCSNATLPPEDWRPVGQHKVHYSDSANGPWEVGGGEMPPGIICNNPSPLLLPNGSVAVFCHGPGIRLWVSPAPGLSPNSSVVRSISQEGSYPIPHTVWEDPFVYFDAKGNWHLLSHVYPTNTSNWSQYADIVAGHAFSRDGIEWTFHRAPPWTADVTDMDGTTRHYATRERPFLLQSHASDLHPMALFTAVTLPGHPKQNYTRDGGDYSFVHVQPVGMNTEYSSVWI